MQTGGGNAKAEKASGVESERLYRCSRGGRYKAGLATIDMMQSVIFILTDCALISPISPLDVSRDISSMFMESNISAHGCDIPQRYYDN